MEAPKFEYKVRRVEGEGTGDIERICNEHAKDACQLVSTKRCGLEEYNTRCPSWRQQVGLLSGVRTWHR